MNGKMMAGIGLVVGIVAIALLAAPAQAYVSGNNNGGMLQTQNQERLKTHDCDCNGDKLQIQEHERHRVQNHDCNCDCAQIQYRYRQRVNEYATNNFYNCTKNMEQYRSQNRERTNLGN
jgi:hypothetical protein